MSNPKGIVLGTKQSGITGKALAIALGAEYTTTPIDYWSSLDYVFRYGNGMVRTDDFGPTGCVMINTLSAVNLAANKIECRQALLNNNVPAPRLFLYEDFTDHNDTIPYPLIARPPQHFQGRNFNVVKDFREAEPFLMKGYYLQEIIDKDVEYRAFMWHGKIFEMNEKTKARMDADPMVRNHRKGWCFTRRPYQEVSPLIRKVCVSAMAVTHLEWAAVDCCLSKDGKPYILEVNSAPGLIDRKVERLAEVVLEYVKEMSARWAERMRRMEGENDQI